jgi:hypothetical protein
VSPFSQGHGTLFHETCTLHTKHVLLVGYLKLEEELLSENGTKMDLFEATSKNTAVAV